MIYPTTLVTPGLIGDTILILFPGESRGPCGAACALWAPAFAGEHIFARPA